MYGKGLIKGLKVTIKRFFSKKVTQQYPDVLPQLPARSHGSFDFDPDKCISCNLCADACPNDVIKVEFHKDAKGKRVLENYNMNLGYCMYCGLCVNACPTDAVNFKTDFNLACFDKDDAVFKWKANTYKSPAAAEPAAPVVEASEKKGA